MLISFFMCNSENNSSIIDNSLQCHSGVWFYLDGTLTIICLIFLLYFTYITVLIFYIPNFILEEKESLKKSNSIPDLILLINKIVFILLFDFIKTSESSHWFFIFFLFVFTWANTWSVFFYNNYENKILKKLNQCLGLILFWSIICLIIGKMFQSWNYNGSMHLFLFGTILIVLIFIYHKEKINEFYTLEFKEIDSGEGRLQYIKNFLVLIKKKDKHRNNFITFNTLILIREENCINKNCKLKKYLEMVEKGYQTDYLLYEYCQQLFEMSLKKFPNDNILKANYIVYLVVQMSKKKLAQKIFATMQEYFLHFQNNYIIFCCKNFIESYSPGKKNIFEESNKNIMRSMEYEKIFNSFKDNLLKASTLYYEFWSSLYKSYLQGTEDFIKLNNIGKKLNLLNDKIEENFKKLHNVRGDDLRVINLYTGFLKNVLNNIKKFNDFKNNYISLSNIDKIQEKEIDYSNFDINILNNTDEYRYIITSAEESNFLNILRVSLNICRKFGYNRAELQGKNVTILFCEKIAKLFYDTVMKYVFSIKSNFYNLLEQKKEYYPEIMEYFVDGVTKSKYLYPLYIKTFYAQTEESDHVFVNEFLNDDLALNAIIKNFNENQLDSIVGKESKIYNLCYVLTDKNFKIHIFTPNCQELLGLNSNAINANIDVTSYIEQFKEDFNKVINEENPDKEISKYDNKDKNLLNYMENFKKNHNSTFKTNISQNNISPEKIILYKRYIAENKFSKARLINWKIYDLIQFIAGNKNNSNISGSYRSQNEKQNVDIFFNKKNIFYGNEKERNFLLVVEKAYINDYHYGYRFFFKREKIKCVEKEDEIKSPNNKNNLLFLVKKDNSERKNSVNFKDLDIGDNAKKGEEEVIHSSKTTNFKKFVKMSKSMHINKKEEDIDDDLIDKNSSKSYGIQNFDDDNGLGKKRTSSLKKNLKKKISRFGSSNDIKSKNYYNKIIINQDYIPTSSFNFNLDLDSMSYKPLYSKAEKNLTNILKNKAMIKIKQYQMKKNNLKKHLSFSSYEESYEDSESVEYDEESSSLNSNSPKENKKKENINNNINEKEKHKEKHREHNISQEIEKEYYKVSGLNKIKYMEYDYEQEMIVDKGVKKDIKSEVENIIINYKLKIPTGMDEESIESDFKIKKFISEGEVEKEKSHIGSSINLTNLGIKNQKKNYKEKEIYKKIENALKKNDKENLIIRLYIVVIFSSIVLLVVCGFVLYFILSSLDTIKTNIFLIICSLNLRHYINMGIYYSREISISYMTYNDSNNSMIYYPIYENRDEYIEKQTAELKKVFFEGHNNMELMLGTNFELDKNNSYYLNEKPFETLMRYDINKQRVIKTSLSVAIVQVYSYFYHLIITEASKNKWEEVFNFVDNAMNSLADGFEEVIKIYLSEVHIKCRKFLINGIILFVVIFIVNVVIYFVIKIIYLKIIFRKESYISMFYDIKLSFIKTSMFKCEKFINTINPNDIEIEKEKNDNGDDSISLSDFGQDFLINNEFNNERKNKNNNLNNNQFRKEIKFKEVSQNRIFKLKLFGILFFSFIYISICIWRFIILLNKIEIMGSYIYTMQHYHNNLLNLGNAYREFIYLNFSQMHNIPIYDYLSVAEKELYESFIVDINFMSDNCYVIPGLCKIYSQIQKTPSCEQSYEDKSNKTKKCDYYMEVATSLGFFNFISFFMEEIRIKKNYVLLMDRYFNVEPMTFLNVEAFFNRTIDYFNNPEIYPDINYMIINIILPIINKERNQTSEFILGVIGSKPILFTIFLIIYFILIILLDIFFWHPIINGIKNLIYKTKNMLTIIPVEILESQTNIKNLLGISDLNE